jgi:hypothetical protein
LLAVMAACLVVVRSARCRDDSPGYKAVNRRSAIINKQSANDSIKPVFTALTWNAAACISTPAPLSTATVSLHRMKCILLVPVVHSHFTSPKRRLGVASSVHRPGQHLVGHARLCDVALSRLWSQRSDLLTSWYISTHYNPVSALPLAACEPQRSLNEPTTNRADYHRSGNQLHEHRTTAMSLNTEIRPADHTSLDQMQQDKTAVQLKGGTYEDEREMARMGKTQELRVWRPTQLCRVLAGC